VLDVFDEWRRALGLVMGGEKVGDIRIDVDHIEAMAIEKSGNRLFVNLTSTSAVGGIDRPVVQPVATREFSREQQHLIALAAHDVLPFAQGFRAQIERGERNHALHRVARLKRA